MAFESREIFSSLIKWIGRALLGVVCLAELLKKIGKQDSPYFGGLGVVGEG